MAEPNPSLFADLPHQVIGDKKILDESQVREVLANSGKTVHLEVKSISSDRDAGKETVVDGVAIPPYQLEAFMEGLRDRSSLLRANQPYIDTTTRVMEETIEDLIQGSRAIGSTLGSELQQTEFASAEVRNFKDLPSINVFLPMNLENKDSFVQRHIIERIRSILQLLQIDGSATPSIVVVVDPTKAGYTDAEAFYHIPKNRIWVKADTISTFDHEAAHLLTNFFGHTDGQHNNFLLNEGLATWVAWKVKTPEEKLRSPNEDYEQQRKVWKNVFKNEDVRVDMEIHNLPAMSFGALFWEILSEKLGGAAALMQHWRKVDEYSTVTEWIASLHLDPKEIEKEWKKRVFAETLSEKARRLREKLRRKLRGI